MKKLPPVALLLMITTSFAQTPAVQNIAYQSHSTIPESLSKNAGQPDDNWLNDAKDFITKSSYAFKQHENSFDVINSDQHIGFNIHASGYEIFPVIPDGYSLTLNKWREKISFSEIRKNSMHILPDHPFICSNDNNFLRFDNNTFSLDYVNDKTGLRQNFIIKNKPCGNSNLEVLLKIQGDLFPSVVNNKLQFTNEKGNIVLFYEDLHVWDANNRVINASMELRDQNTLAIVVNDQLATYPLTIDPLNKTPEWTSSANGILPTLVGQMAIDAAYGFSVAGLGDVNGDGYDDVAIGAPTMSDIVAGSGALANVGAVFIYYGSINGLPVTPSAVLQPTTAVAGALFGYSIAAGDINNDGKSDIIIGAPMDVVSISIGGGNTASGTVGKVYVYNGSALNTSTDPFATLSLNGSGILENGVNLSVNALFGFSVAVTEDLNNDGKKDIIVGSPCYAGIKTGLFGNSILDVQSGGAFVFLSNGSSSTMVKLNPIKTSLLGLGIGSVNINGLLFGYSVDGLGDYNGDSNPDVVASAPAGVDLGSISALLNGKLLQGSATVYYGNGTGINTNPGATLTAASGGLLSNLAGSISNLANMFGISVKGVRSAGGVRNGNVLVGAPLGGALTNILSLQLKTGTVSLFIKKPASPSGYVTPDQVLSSPRNDNSILGLIECNLLFGYAIDNTYDLNCDGIGDIIIGEPASSGVQLLNANVAGGAAYVYFGQADGTYQSSPSWSLTATEDAFLGINGTSLIGYCVAGAGHVRGNSFNNKLLIGTPSRSLDFGAGLLNLGATLNTLFSLTSGNNGVGKSYLYDAQFSCGASLPITLTTLKGSYANGMSHLSWATLQEINSSHFDIEHSNDGTVYTVIGKVNAVGNSSVRSDYGFDDSKVKQGINYYRLKMTDRDGRYSYSNVVSVNARIKGTLVTAIYPTVFTDKVNINIASETSVPANISLFDNTGKLLIKYRQNVPAGANTITLNKLNNLCKGSYIIQVQAGETSIARKIIN